MAKKNKGRGWHGDSAGHAKAGRKGGLTTAKRYGRKHYEKIGEKGGEASSGKFRQESQRTKTAGRS